MTFEELDTRCPFCHCQELNARAYHRPSTYTDPNSGYIYGYECPKCGLCGYGEDELEAYEDMIENVPLHRITEAIYAVAKVLNKKQ